MSDQALATLQRECGDSLDPVTFEQILEMDDDDDDREFSRSLVYGFFEQVTGTFKGMHEALEQRDLKELSRKGHFLKGSSATIGLTNMKNSCEKIQHLGNGKAIDGERDEDSESCLEQISDELPILKAEFVKIEKPFRKFYGHDPTDE